MGAAMVRWQVGRVEISLQCSSGRRRKALLQTNVREKTICKDGESWGPGGVESPRLTNVALESCSLRKPDRIGKANLTVRAQALSRRAAGPPTACQPRVACSFPVRIMSRFLVNRETQALPNLTLQVRESSALYCLLFAL